MKTGETYESEATARGFRLRAVIGKQPFGPILAIQERAAQRTAAGELEGVWWTHCEIGLCLPCGEDRARRVLTHLVTFYDEALVASLDAVLEWFRGVPPQEAAGSVPPGLGGQKN